MIEILSKPADQIDIRDINSLIASSVPEGEQIEFKQGLPTKDAADPWMTGKNHIGHRARDVILKEVVAFANAHGGALLLGIKESATNPPVATNISPLPRCADLAELLKDVFLACVEPHLPRIEIFAVPNQDVDGVIVIRVGRSRLAPHRVKTTRFCPVRRSDRCENMTMREIQDMTLNVARGLELLERKLSARAHRFRQEFERLQTPENAFGIRLTAAPVGEEIRISRVFHQGQLAEEFNEPWHNISHRTGSDERELSGLKLLHNRFPLYWRPRLRAARAESSFNPADQLLNCYRELHCDGLVEVGLVSVGNFSDGASPATLVPDWPLDVFANMAVWADNVRRKANAPTTEYALEFEIGVTGAAVPVARSTIFLSESPKLQPGFRTFPRYPMGDPSEILELLEQFYRDFWNFLGEDIGAEVGTFKIVGWSI